MEEAMRSSAELEDVVELMHRIQLRLSVAEAAHTSVLSKSWLRAWSTIPTLRLRVGRKRPLKLVDVDRTLARYLRDNLPIERFDLVVDINQESASRVENWIRHVATRTCFKELSLLLFLYDASFTLPDEILSGENLTKIWVKATLGTQIHSIWMTTHPVIKCVTLRELYLENVRISEKVFDEILSSCNLLVKIELIHSCKGFKAIKVKNLHWLQELKLVLDDQDSTALKISHVPNLRVFTWDLQCKPPTLLGRPPVLLLPFNAHSISLGRNVTQLFLGGVFTDNDLLEKITSGFSFLESLTLEFASWTLGSSFNFTCASIKRLSLLGCLHRVTDVQVYAPKLVFFKFSGCTMPNLSFPISSLEEIELSLRHHYRNPIDASFFLKMREALMLSSKCCLHITHMPPLDIDIDDLRTRLTLPPAKNVHELRFHTTRDECLWERSPFFAAFFEICHPKLVVANPDASFKRNNHFCKLMLREVLENKTASNWSRYLKCVRIKRSLRRKWETLTKSHTSFLEGPAPSGYVRFKLNWS